MIDTNCEGGKANINNCTAHTVLYRYNLFDYIIMMHVKYKIY